MGFHSFFYRFFYGFQEAFGVSFGLLGGHALVGKLVEGDRPGAD